MHSAVTVTATGADEMRAVGRALAGLVRAGDLVVLSGGLGAGKTTLTQGIGAGLGVRGAVTSPTFVIARVHPSEVGGPALVNVDAYRLGGTADVTAEVDDLDLDASLEDSVTVVEWGEGVVEELADARLEVVIERARGGDAAGAEFEGDARRVRIRGVGERWAGVDLGGLAATST
jgi:tRNA threonylcarbamoyladenosine biosynthesis protein TsaE